jgi:hypothetical protein
MPDRDEFARRPRAFKALAAMFERMAGGAPADLGTAEDALRRLIVSAGGLASLEPLIASLEGIHQRGHPRRAERSPSVRRPLYRYEVDGSPRPKSAVAGERV